MVQTKNFSHQEILTWTVSDDYVNGSSLLA